MISKVLSAAAVALAASQLVAAQTFTDCNPLEKKCDDNPALGTTVQIDFTKGPTDFFDVLAGTTIDTYDPALGAKFSIKKETDAPTIASKKYIFFGSVSVITRAAPGKGIVSSIVLQSADLDEIDWEWLGADAVNVQTNYFGKGDTSTYDRGAFHKVDKPFDSLHNYTIDWTPEYLAWIINGVQVRKLLYSDAKGGSTYPQSPCQLKLGTWVAGKAGAAQGTVDWAGGFADFSQAPFDAYYQSITVSDYHKGATKYVWPEVKAGTKGDGNWKNIIVVRDGSTGTTTTASSAAPSNTGSGSTKSETSTKSTVVSTVSPTRGLTQATDGSDVKSSSSVSSSSTLSTSTTPSSTGSAAPAATTSARPNGAMKQGLEWSHAAVMGAGLFLGLAVL